MGCAINFQGGDECQVFERLKGRRWKRRVEGECRINIEAGKSNGLSNGISSDLKEEVTRNNSFLRVFDNGVIAFQFKLLLPARFIGFLSAIGSTIVPDIFLQIHLIYLLEENKI